ncbi:MAG: hypothetical protein ACOH2H_22430 [Cypionkella sp.]
MITTGPKLKLRATAERNTLKVGDETFDSLAALVARHPGFAKPEGAADLALAANHLHRGGDYDPILDPAAYEAAYRARLAGEDPSVGWSEGPQRLSDYGIPDFAQISAPQIDGEEIVFFAREALTGLAYRASASLNADTATYEPLRLTPVDRPAPAKQVAAPGAVMPDVAQDPGEADAEGEKSAPPATPSGEGDEIEIAGDDEK